MRTAIAGSALIVCLGCVTPNTTPPSPAPAAVPTPAPVARSVEGGWVGVHGPWTFDLLIVQHGREFQGALVERTQNHGGLFEGTVDGDHVHFVRAWLNDERVYSQIYDLTLAPDGRHLDGSFTETHAPGRAMPIRMTRGWSAEPRPYNGTEGAAADLAKRRLAPHPDVELLRSMEQMNPNPMTGRCDCKLLATGTVAAARAGAAFHAGPSKRMPRTRLTATTKYTAPNIGHQRAPARSIHSNRCNHCSLSTAGR